MLKMLEKKLLLEESIQTEHEMKSKLKILIMSCSFQTKIEIYYLVLSREVAQTLQLLFLKQHHQLQHQEEVLQVVVVVVVS
jgi:hypothetical protein